MKKLCVNRNIKCGFIIVIPLVMFIVIIFICMYKGERRVKKEEKQLYEYTYSPSETYKVNLVPNNYYDQLVMEEGKKYIGNLADSIDIVFEGDFVGDKIANITMEYQIMEKIEGYQLASGNKDIIIEKVNELSDKTTNIYSYYGCNYKVSENIDLGKYESLVSNIKGELGISLSLSVTVYLEGNITVDYEIEGKTNTVKIPVLSQVTIPIASSLFVNRIRS